MTDIPEGLPPGRDWKEYVLRKSVPAYKFFSAEQDQDIGKCICGCGESVIYPKEAISELMRNGTYAPQYKKEHFNKLVELGYFELIRIIGDR